jgi:hypothetical protein
VWAAATLKERRDIITVMFVKVTCDPEARCLVALQPKPAFAPLFKQHAQLHECDGVFEIKPTI